MKDTRERIITQAFSLFAERGYHAVSVRDIAEAVGIKDASLYNHFPSKQAIFNTVITSVLHETQRTFARQGVMYTPADDPTGYAESIAETERRVLTGFRHFFADEDMIKLRRLLTMSQFDSPRADEAYRLIFIEQPIAIQKAVFEHLMARGYFARDDAEVMAREFYGPVLLLLLDGYSWRRAKPLIVMHLQRFIARYAASNNAR